MTTPSAPPRCRGRALARGIAAGFTVGVMQEGKGASRRVRHGKLKCSDYIVGVSLLPEQPSALRELFNTFGISILGAGAAIGAIAFGGFVATRSDDAPERFSNTVSAQVIAFSENCPADRPLEVTLTNLDQVEIRSVGFSVNVQNEGHSTIYYSSSDPSLLLRTDKIINPGQSSQECFRMPDFGQSGIPYILEAPKYEIVVRQAELGT